MMFRSTASPQQMVAPGSGRSDPNRIVPYLTHLETHHGQPTPASSPNARRTRKSEKKIPERPRPDRRREPDEPRFNVAAPTHPRGATRRSKNSAGRAARVPVPPPNAVRDSMIPDYPPPSFQEALMTPPFIPPPLSEASTDGPQQDTPEVDPAPDTSFAPSANHPEPLSHAAEPTQPPSLTVQTAVGPSGSPLSSPSSQPSSDQSGSSGSGSDESSSNTSSVEIVNYDNVSEGWEADRRRGVPLTERIVHERRRLLVAESTTNLVSCHLTPSDHADTSHHADTASTHGLCTHCGSPKPSSVNGRQLAPSPDLTEYEPDGLTPPSSPKSKKGWRKLLQPIIAHDTKAVHGSDSPPSPMPKSPTTTGPLGLGFLQGAWSSTLTLASTNGSSPSKAADSSSPSSIKRRETSGVRRLFAKGKDRDWSPPAPPDADDEPWEVVNRASVLWAEEQEHKSGSRSISPVSEVSQEHGYVSPMSPSPRSTRRQALASPQTTPFLNRPIRHPAMNGSTLTLPMNHSVVSLQSSTAAGSGAGRPSPTSDLGAHDTQSQKKAKRPPPPPPPPRRKAMSTTMKASPSAVWLPLIDTQAAASVRSYAEVASPAQTLASPMTATTIVTPYEPRPYPSLPSLRPSSPDGAETTYSLPSPPPSAGLYGSFNVPMSVPVQDSDAVSIASSYAGMSSAPATRYNPAQTRVPPPVVTVTDSMSTISIESPSITPPRTPTTPTHPHHYPGRPLPQPPRSQPPHQPQPALPCRQPSPLRTTAAVASPVSPAVSPISEHSYFSDLDDLASRVIEGDHNGRNYEDLMHISEFARPANAAQDPFVVDETTLKIPPSGRVRAERRRARDGRVKLKLTLLGEPVDKCGICLSRFKDAEVACLGTHCQHAFHEYCLKRRLIESRKCPLCLMTI